MKTAKHQFVHSTHTRMFKKKQFFSPNHGVIQSVFASTDITDFYFENFYNRICDFIMSFFFPPESPRILENYDFTRDPIFYLANIYYLDD